MTIQNVLSIIAICLSASCLINTAHANLQEAYVPENEKVRSSSYIRSFFNPDNHMDIDIPRAERKLEQNPTDYEAFWGLVSHYYHKFNTGYYINGFDDEREEPFFRKKIESLVLHGSKHFPDSNLMADVLGKLGGMVGDFSEGYFDEMEVIWQANVEKHRGDRLVLRNLGIYLESIRNYELALLVYNEVDRMKPNQVRVIKTIKDLYLHIAKFRATSAEQMKRNYAAAYDQSLRLIEIYKNNEQQRSYSVCKAMSYAFNADYISKARELAHECLSYRQSGLQQEYSIIDARFLLAKIYHREGDLEATREQLKKITVETAEHLNNSSDRLEALLKQYMQWGMVKEVDDYLASIKPGAPEIIYNELAEIRNNTQLAEQGDGIDFSSRKGRSAFHAAKKISKVLKLLR